MTEAIEAIKALATGLATTFKHLFRKPITEEYPEYKRTLPERTRARIILTCDPDGKERCVACYLCSAACPVSCISMQSAQKENGRRHAAWFRINFARCIYCGLCEEACPTSAIQLTPLFETCERDILKLVYEKEDLLVDKGDLQKTFVLRRILNPMGTTDAIEFLIGKLKSTKTNSEFFDSMKG